MGDILRVGPFQRTPSGLVAVEGRQGLQKHEEGNMF